MTASWWYVDPADRFRAIASGSAQPGIITTNGNPSLTSEAIAAVIGRQRRVGADETQVSTAVAQHVAQNSSLTVGAAEPLVARALTSATDDAGKAAAVSAAVSGVGVSGSVDLSDPVMLGPAPRMCAAGLLGVIAILAAVFADHLTGASWIAYLAMILFGVLGILGIIIMVMGYRTVSISGSSTPSAPSSGS